jgi:hypothetical protein
MQQAYSIANSFKILNEYSNNFNVNYDIIIKCRMDIDLKNIMQFIELMQSGIRGNDLYVAGNHWQYNLEFDDNIMVGKFDMMNEIYVKFFEYTINIINETKIIPGGEQNIFKYINKLNLINNVKKVQNLNFDLLTYKKNEEIILNQNEI